MKNNGNKLSQFSSFKIVLFYAAVSGIYIYTSDYFLKIFVKDIELLSNLQTYKGLGFILITTALLYVLVKRNIDTTSAYYQEIIDTKEVFDNQLKNSQEEYMSLFNHSPLPMWIFDIKTLKFLLVNESACLIYGYMQEEYMQMSLLDIFPPDDVSAIEQAYFNSVKSENIAFPSVVRHRKKNGEIIQVKLKTAFVTFGGNQVRLASAVDITAEVNVQNELMETNAKLQLASEIAGLGYWTNDLVKSEIQWSEEIYKIFEVNPSTFKLSLQSIKERFHPEDQLNFTPSFFDNFNDSSIKESEHRIYTDSGQVKWILERQYLVRDKDGNPIKLNGIALDITKRKLYEQELTESNERFKILTKATIEAIIDWDIKNNKVMWGEGFQTLLGYDISSSGDDLWSSNIHPDDREKVLTDLNDTLSDPTKMNFNAEFRFLKADGSIAYVQHKGVFVRDANGTATRALGAMIDLTETLERMRKIEMQNKALKDIAWTQSHIVRAPLANLLGLTELLKDNSNSGIEDSQLVDYIRESAEKLDIIIHDIINKTIETENIN